MEAILIIVIIATITIAGFWFARLWNARKEAETEDDKSVLSLIIATIIIFTIGDIVFSLI